MTQDKDTQFFARYMDKNAKLKHSLENIKKYANGLKEHSDEIRDEALKSSTTFFGEQLISVGDLNSIMETLEFNDSKLTQVLDELISTIDEENKKVHEHLGKLKINTAEIKERFDHMLISYNQEKHRKREIFSNLLGIVMKVAHNIIGVVEEEDKQLAKDYLEMYNNLETMIIAKAGNEQIFSHFAILLKFLTDLQSGKKIGAVLEDVKSKKNVHQFLKNFKTNNASKDITEQYKKLAEEIDSKPYPSLDKDLKDKLGKFMRDRLKLLFTGIKLKLKEETTNKEIDFKKLIEIKEDIEELKKTFNDYYSDLAKILHNEGLKRGNTISDFTFKTDSFDGTFKTFKTKVKDNDINKDELNDAINYVETLIESKDEDDGAYNTFKEDNKSLFKLDLSEGNSSTGGKKIDDIKKYIKNNLGSITGAIQSQNFATANNLLTNLYKILFKDGTNLDYDYFKKIVSSARGKKKFNEVEPNISKLAENVISFVKANNSANTDASNSQAWLDFLANIKIIF